MNVTLQKNDDVSARMTVEVIENDYKEKAEKELRKIGQTHAIPGFRKGHVPFGELKRRFGVHVASDVINEVVYEAVAAYLKDNNIHVLGEPVPVEVKELDFKNQKDYTFEYDLALMPEIKVAVDKNIKVPYYNIEITDEMIDKQDKDLRKRFGAQVPGETVEDDALVKGVLMQLNEDGTVNENAGAIQVPNAIVAPFYFTDKDEAAKFLGHKVGDKVVFNPWKSCNGNVAELASMLNIDRAIAGDIHSDFEMAISEIIVVRLAELGEEYYTNVFGKDKVTDEASYREALKEMVANQLSGAPEYVFRRDAQKAIMDRCGDFNLADDILKRWFLSRKDEDLNAENIDERYAEMLPNLKWELISGRIAEQADVQVSEEDMVEGAKQRAARQLAQYGMTNLGDDIIADYANRMLSDKKFARDLYAQIGDMKLFNAIKTLITVEPKSVSMDDFAKL